MRRVSGVVLAGAVVLLPASINVFAQAAPAQGAAPAQAQLKDALQKSAKPEAKQQAAGWKVFKNSTPNPDGSIVYVHVINPVVKDADYSILNNIYDLVTDPMEKLNVYNTYRGALKQALFVIQGQMTQDL